MNTPIADFVRGYEKLHIERFHMPGHKGKSFLGCEKFDITEVKGADALYEAEGIISESEANATRLFGTGRTVYSTEGSSQCIRAMLYLALTNCVTKPKGRPKVVATRNVHKAFIYAAALLDLDVIWIYPENDMHSVGSCQISSDVLNQVLMGMNEPPIAVYVTSPDYLGGQLDIASFAEICHKHGTILAVDNAHGAYLHFIETSRHPIDLGADICCDSAHKTLPVLTGGAYLQISKNAPEGFARNAKNAMALFGSTSPSYLILSSLDLCNRYLEEEYSEKLPAIIKKIVECKEQLKLAGWQVEHSDPLKLTIRVPNEYSGEKLAERLRRKKMECEYADPSYLVCMFTPENNEECFQLLLKSLGENSLTYKEKETLMPVHGEQICSIREAVFSLHEEIDIDEAEGRICASPTVSCPPAIPIVVSGEKITMEAIEMFKYYGITTIDVIKGKEEKI